jgi:hypothetical protein
LGIDCQRITGLFVTEVEVVIEVAAIAEVVVVIEVAVVDDANAILNKCRAV